MRVGVVVRALTIAVVAGSLAACSSSSKPAAAPASSVATSSTVAPGHRVDAVLDDTGLHLPPDVIDAGTYLVAFTDRRANPPAGQHVSLQFRPSGPLIVLAEVPAGQAKPVLMEANLIAEVAFDGKRAMNVAVDHQLSVRPTPEYPTPVT